MQAKNLACQSRAELRRVQLGKIGLKANMKAPVSCTRVKCDSFFGSSWLSRLSCSLPAIDFHLEHVYELHFYALIGAPVDREHLHYVVVHFIVR